MLRLRIEFAPRASVVARTKGAASGTPTAAWVVSPYQLLARYRDPPPAMLVRAERGIGGGVGNRLFTEKAGSPDSLWLRKKPATGGLLGALSKKRVSPDSPLLLPRVLPHPLSCSRLARRSLGTRKPRNRNDRCRINAAGKFFDEVLLKTQT
jgi:hypothetical protein